jgi:hypothetical protein
MKGSNGYDIHGYYPSTKVSFHPPFYSYQGCNPEAVYDTFVKQYTVCYNNNYISGFPGVFQGQSSGGHVHLLGLFHGKPPGGLVRLPGFHNWNNTILCNIFNQLTYNTRALARVLICLTRLLYFCFTDIVLEWQHFYADSVYP